MQSWDNKATSQPLFPQCCLGKRVISASARTMRKCRAIAVQKGGCHAVHAHQSLVMSICWISIVLELFCGQLQLSLVIKAPASPSRKNRAQCLKSICNWPLRQSRRSPGRRAHENPPPVATTRPLMSQSQCSLMDRPAHDVGYSFQLFANPASCCALWSAF